MEETSWWKASREWRRQKEPGGRVQMAVSWERSSVWGRRMGAMVKVGQLEEMVVG